MKKYLLLGVLLVSIACQKLDIRPLTIFGELQLSNLTNKSIKMTTKMADLAGDVSQHGYCWATTPNPTINDTKVELGNLNIGAEGEAVFESVIENLTSNTRYYLRAFVQVGSEVAYSEQVVFNTLMVSSFISVSAVNNVSNTTAEVQGNILRFEPGVSYIQYGHCWATQATPTINDLKTELGQPTTLGTFTSNLDQLQAQQQYYVRAYMITSAGEVIYSSNTEDFDTGQ